MVIYGILVYLLRLVMSPRLMTAEDNNRELYHPYEYCRLITDMAMKFYTNTDATPYVEIKGSPLKLLQGHNVYGFECMRLAAIHMLGMLTDAFPKLLPILDFQAIEVLCLDTTYIFRLPHQTWCSRHSITWQILHLVTVKLEKSKWQFTLVG